jgi:hypothetical protein
LHSSEPVAVFIWFDDDASSITAAHFEFQLVELSKGCSSSRNLIHFRLGQLWRGALESQTINFELVVEPVVGALFAPPKSESSRKFKLR